MSSSRNVKVKSEPGGGRSMNMVGGGAFESGWDHYIQFGRKEGRMCGSALEISPEGGISGRCERPICSGKDAT